jgi:conjugative transfer signal peptidase TraF
VCVVSFWVLAFAFGLRYNRTPSLPRGFYSSAVVEQSELAPGQIVLICPPEETALFALERGYIRKGACPSGVSPLGKVVVAMEGDTVVVDERGVSVNGFEVPFSQPLFEDSIGRPIWPVLGTIVVPEDQVYVLSNYHGRSFDSRYIGPLPAADVSRTLEPLLTWGTDWEDDLRTIF